MYISANDVMSEINGENTAAVDEITENVENIENIDDADVFGDEEIDLSLEDSDNSGNIEETLIIESETSDESADDLSLITKEPEVFECKDEQQEEEPENCDTDLVIPKGALLKGDLLYKGTSIILGKVQGSFTGGSKVILDGGTVANCVIGESVGIFHNSSAELIKANNVFVSKNSKITTTEGIKAKQQIIIGEKGVLESPSIEAKFIEITGAVKAHITGGKVVLHKGAIIKGDIEAGSLTIEDGVAINGSCVQNCKDNIDESIFS